MTAPAREGPEKTIAMQPKSLSGLAGESWKPYLQQPGSVRAYLLSAAFVFAALAVNTGLSLLSPSPPLVILIVAILLSGLFCGVRSTVIMAFLGVTAVFVFRFPIGFVSSITPGQRIIRAVVFATITGMVVWITATLRRALFEAESARLKVDAALGQGNVGAWEIDLEARMVRASVNAHAMFGLHFTGRPLHIDRWLERVHPDDVGAVRTSFVASQTQNTPFLAEYRLMQDSGPCTWILSRGGLITVDGKRRLVGAFVDVTDRHLADERYRETSALLRTIIETAPVLIYAKDLQGRMLLANVPTLKLIGKPWEEVAGKSDPEFLDDATQGSIVAANDRRLMASGKAEHLEETVDGPDGSPRVWSSAKAPIRDGLGNVTGLVGVSIEITEQKRIERRLRLMIDELNHRVKNTLAIVLAIVVKTLNGTDPVSRQALESRLLALSGVHDVLTGENWEGADLAQVLSVVLLPYGGAEDARFTIVGPRLRLSPKAAQGFAMGFHELATNALKYGGMANASGKVDITWMTTDEASPRLRLTWTERGGPPVRRPTRSGFGSWLMTRGLPHDLAGTVNLSFDDPAGVVCVIEAPLSEIVASPVTAFPLVGAMDARV